MPFVKLDTKILDSTLWIERECREIFITALLMASPFQVETPMQAFKVSAIEPLGFTVPPGWYGFVPAAGPGIVRRAGVALEIGIASLEKLSQPDHGSRSPEFEGRRMVRVDGGYIVLNYMKYRDRDYTAAERQRRLRERKKLAIATRDSNDVTRDSNVTSRIAESRIHTNTSKEGGIILSSIKPNGKHPPPSKTYEQSDFDERDLRKLCAAEKEIMFRMAARIGCEPVTDQEFFTAACDEAGITVERGLKLKEMQRKWPEGAQ